MQREIEKKIFNLYKRILNKSNFGPGYYNDKELKQLCNEVSGLYLDLSAYVLASGGKVSLSPPINDIVRKIKSFAC
jgi:hypothetical protein